MRFHSSLSSFLALLDLARSLSSGFSFGAPEFDPHDFGHSLIHPTKFRSLMAMDHTLIHPLIAEPSRAMKIQPTLTALRTACFPAKEIFSRTQATVSRELVAVMCPELCTNACAVPSSGVAVRTGACRVCGVCVQLCTWPAPVCCGIRVEAACAQVQVECACVARTINQENDAMQNAACLSFAQPPKTTWPWLSQAYTDPSKKQITQHQ